MDPISALFSASWRTYKERFTVLIKIALIPALFLALGTILVSRGFPASVFGSLFNLAGGILTIFASIAAILSLEQKTDFNGSYRKSVSFFWPFLWVSILSGLAVIGGFIMLIVPGIILSIALGFSRFIVIVENRRGLNVLTQSRAYAKGYWWAILGRYVLLGLCFAAVMLVIDLPITLLLGKVTGALIYAILLLFITPFSFVYLYNIYKNLAALKPEVAASQATTGKKFLTASAIVGLATPIILLILFIILIAVFAKPYLDRNSKLLQQLQYQYEYGAATSTATSTANSTNSGMHCGNSWNLPSCPSGYHCKLNPNITDGAGVCVAN
jgi:hypothetical protein